MPKQKDKRARKSSIAQPPKVSVNTYYGNRGPANTAPSPFEKKPTEAKYRKKLIKLADILILLVFVSAFAASLMLKPRSQVFVNDTTYHNQNYYSDFINNKLADFGNRNKITFSEDNLKKSIIAAFPEVIAVHTQLPILGQTPKVRLEVAKPAFFLRSGTDDYLLSANGVTVDLKSYYRSLGHLPTIEDQSGFAINKGKQVLSQQNVSFLQTITAQVEKQNVPVQKFVIPKIPQEVNLYTQDAKFYTRFFMGGDSALQAGQYLAARNKFKTSPPPYQYLDVRVAGKIFYK